MKLNLGFGGTIYPGFTNVDFSPDENPDIVANVEELPLPDGSADFIFASHILEHVGYRVDVMKEWHRVLKDDGRILICVPDVLCMAAMYNAGVVSRDYFQATIYGASYMGLDDNRHTHHRSYTPIMLQDEMFRYFTNLDMRCEEWMPRERFAGEIVCGGIKRKLV